MRRVRVDGRPMGSFSSLPSHICETGEGNKKKGEREWSRNTALSTICTQRYAAYIARHRPCIYVVCALFLAMPLTIPCLPASVDDDSTVVLATPDHTNRNYIRRIRLREVVMSILIGILPTNRKKERSDSNKHFSQIFLRS